MEGASSERASQRLLRAPRVNPKDQESRDHRGNQRLVLALSLSLPPQACRPRGCQFLQCRGTALGQMVLRQILLHGAAYVMPEPRMLITNAYERFDQNGDLTDEETPQRLRRFLEALHEWTGQLDRAGLIEKV
jgi:hypothetical protein